MNQFILKFATTVPGFVSPMMFSDLIDIPTGEYKVPFNLFGLEPPPEDKVTEELEKRYNHQVIEDFPAYSQWPVFQRDRLYEIAGKTMEHLGYS